MQWGLQVESSSVKQPAPSRKLSSHRQPALRRRSPAPAAVAPAAAAAAAAAATSSLNVNMGISIDYGATKSGVVESPLRCVSEARRQMTEQHRIRKNSRPLLPQPDPSSLVAAAQGPNPPKVRRESKLRCCPSAMTEYDSFDECLEFAEQMDSVLAYYYADEKSSTSVKVVEIFPVLHHRPHSASAGHSHHSHEQCSSAGHAHHSHEQSAVASCSQNSAPKTDVWSGDFSAHMCSGLDASSNQCIYCWSWLNSVCRLYV